MNVNWLDNHILTRLNNSKNVSPILTRSDMQLVKLSNAIIRVRHLGKGDKTIVFVCDPPNVIEHYDKLFELLSPYMNVICFELPGFGYSMPKKGFSYLLEEQVALTLKLLAKFKMAPYILAFPCVTGYIAFEIAKNQPHLVDKLVITQTADWSEGIKWMQGTDIKGILGTPIVGQIAMGLFNRFMASSWTKAWYKQVVPEKEKSKQFQKIALDALNNGANCCFASLYQAFYKQSTPDYSNIKQSSISIWGENDTTHAKTNKKSILEYVPDTQYSLFENSGHYPYVQEPERFSKMVLGFK